MGVVRVWGFVFGVFALAAGCAMRGPEPPRKFPQTGAHLAATVYLSKRGPDQSDAKFYFPAVTGGVTEISLGSTAQNELNARLSCDGPARLRPQGKTGPGLYLRPGAVRTAVVPPSGNQARPVLVVPAQTARCEISWGDGPRLTLLREGAPVSATGGPAACPDPRPAPGDALARVFYADWAMDMTCAAPSGKVSDLPDEIDALKWRLDHLTGGDVSRASLKDADPDAVLDFSRAPRFDEIIVSYLFVRADVSGWLTLRALAYHAARGTRVRVLTSAALTPAFDRRPYEALAAQYPNVSVQYYRFAPTGPGSILTHLQRSNHVKVFLARSTAPGRSFALIGGRNLADDYFLDGAPDTPDHPFLRSYATDTKSLSPVEFHNLFDDYEVVLADDARVAEIARQFGRYFNRDTRREVMLPGADLAPVGAVGGGEMRHFISLPWADGRALAQLYVDLFDAARSEIFVVSPFNYPPPAIEAALVRAAARGVDVRFVTRKGADEPPAVFTRSLNAQFDDKMRGTFRFRLYVNGNRYLHAKIVVIDDRFGMVASSNLNRRSFIHDTENGVMFLDRAVTRMLKAEAEKLWAFSQTADDPAAYRFPLALFETIPWLKQFF